MLFPGLSEVNELVKLPIPFPSVVLLSEVVGFPLEFQQTPRDNTSEPPSAVIVLPTVAEFAVTFVASEMVTVEATFRDSFLQLYRKDNNSI